MRRPLRKLVKNIVSSRRKRYEQYHAHHVVHRLPTVITGRLSIKYRHENESKWTDLGVVSEAIVTDAAISTIIGVFIGGSASTMQSFKYHDTGTSSTAESSAQTTLVSPIGDTRDEGTQTIPVAGTYRSIATHTYSDPAAITEHGIFSAIVGGTMLDRSVFSAIDVEVNTQIQFTYDLVLTGA